MVKGLANRPKVLADRCPGYETRTGKKWYVEVKKRKIYPEDKIPTTLVAETFTNLLKDKITSLQTPKNSLDQK